MNLEVTIEERRRTTMTEAEARRVAVEMIARACKLKGGTYILDGQLCFDERDGGGGHAWVETVKVRAATELDTAALAVIAQLTGGRG